MQEIRVLTGLPPFSNAQTTHGRATLRKGLKSARYACWVASCGILLLKLCPVLCTAIVVLETHVSAVLFHWHCRNHAFTRGRSKLPFGARRFLLNRIYKIFIFIHLKRLFRTFSHNSG